MSCLRSHNSIKAEADEFREEALDTGCMVAVLTQASSSSSHPVLQPAGVSPPSTLSSRASVPFQRVPSTGPVNRLCGRGGCVCARACTCVVKTPTGKSSSLKASLTPSLTCIIALYSLQGAFLSFLSFDPYSNTSEQMILLSLCR